MEYFKSGLKSVLGSPPQDTQQSGAETVERLIARIQHSTLLEDRRDACRAIKALSKKFRVEVGAQGMDVLRQVLENDRRDNEIVSYALGSLCNIMDDRAYEEQEANAEQGSGEESVGEQFTEIFIKHPENVGLILGLMEEYDFNVRWPAVKLFTSMLSNKPKEIQEIVLVSPMGVSKLMDLLGDSREVIRNDALLLLIKLAKGNANIQKIVAFENAFDRLFDVICEEGFAEGGVVVEDCLLLLLTLLRNNISNQNFFKEGSYIIKLVKMFDVPKEAPDSGWSSQKVSIIHLLLQVVRTLVNPGNPAQAISACQKAMHVCGLLAHLCMILMAGGVPASLLTDTMNTVAEVIRGTQSNQDYFCGVTAPSNPPRPAIVVLLMSMVNEKQPFSLRCAVLYCFQCYLYKNEAGQAQIVQTLLPSSTEVGSLSAGQLLCGGLFNGDSLSNWYSAVALSHCLIENPAMKEQLLRVLLATNVGSPPVSLLQQCSMLLQQGNKFQTRIGLLMLLSTWLSHCPGAVKQFLSIPSSIPYLTSQAGSNEHDENEELVQGMCAFVIGICIQFNDNSVESYSKENLRQLIIKRIGLETYLDKLGEVSRHESYSKAAKQPQLQAKQPSELLLDHEFCRLFKALEGVVIKSVTLKPPSDFTNGSSDDAHLHGTEEALASCIHQRDETIREYKTKMKLKDVEVAVLKSACELVDTSRLKLRDVTDLLEGQRECSESPNDEDDREVEEMKRCLQQIRELNESLKGKVDSYESGKDMTLEDVTDSLRQLRNLNQTLKAQADKETGNGGNGEQLELANINELERTKPVSQGTQDVENAFGRTSVEIQTNIASARTKADSSIQTESNEPGVTNTTGEVARVEASVMELFEQLKTEIQGNRAELAHLRSVEEELRRLRLDQEDLLVLVAEQQTQISDLESKLDNKVPTQTEDSSSILSIVGNR